MNVVLLAGGFGGARMAHGFALLGEQVELTVIGNTGDDLELHGLYVSPDLDTVMYTLAGLANLETGWGVRDETWSARQMLERYGQPSWFSLGDRDLATHIVRTARLRAGQRLTEVTAELCRALDVPARLLPMTDDEVRTKIRTPAGWLDFQEYFVRNRHADEVLDVRFAGLADARVTPEVADAVRSAELLVIAPSNPHVSVAPILAIPGMPELVRETAAPVIAVSPIVGGATLRGPADRMLRSLGGEASAAGVAGYYATSHPGVVDVLVVDESDAAEVDRLRQTGIAAHVSRIVMRNDDDRQQLAGAIIEAARTMRR
jgi:LPPG:FO 2-phospho-L-lactate transferase